MQTNLKSISISETISIPASVKQACDLLTKNGFKAYLAGGCVRDLMLNIKAKDHDIVTNAPIEKIKELFPKHLDVGESFGVIKLVDGIDIAIFRKESNYSDHRHPDKVDIGDEVTDTQRRDFTINALYLDVKEKTVLDYVDGIKDIQSKTIRTVGNAKDRFKEDALRIMRAIRFSAQLGFKIEKSTQTALKECANLLKKISRERIRDELFKTLLSDRPVIGLELFTKVGVWEIIFGIKKTAIPADFRSLKFNEKPSAISWIVSLAVTGMFGDPLKDQKEMLTRLVELIKLTNEEKKILQTALGVFEDCMVNEKNPPNRTPQEWIEFAINEKQVIDLMKRFIRRARGVDADHKEQAIKFIDQCHRWGAKKNYDKSFLTAQALIKKGIPEGPKLGKELKISNWKLFWDLTL